MFLSNEIEISPSFKSTKHQTNTWINQSTITKMMMRQDYQIIAKTITWRWQEEARGTQHKQQLSPPISLYEIIPSIIFLEIISLFRMMFQQKLDVDLREPIFIISTSSFAWFLKDYDNNDSNAQSEFELGLLLPSLQFWIQLGMVRISALLI